MTIFLNYLLQVKVLLVDGYSNHKKSHIRILRLIANRPDFLLPFRQKAPTIEQALSTIYVVRDRLLRPEGLWNILMFRGVTYGSPYAKYDLQWFDTCEEWTRYFTESEDSVENKSKSKDDPPDTPEDKKMRYFVNISAYGFNNIHRTLENIPVYWEERDRWTSFMKGKPGVKETYRFLTNSKGTGKKIFPNIGSLTALLVCGDLIEMEILDMPAIEDWAKLIHHVQKGATMGLQALTLLGEKFTEEEVVDAFTQLHAFLLENLSEEDQELMGYNIVMLEHALCKFTRILTNAEKAKSTHKKKPHKKRSSKKLKST